MKKCKILLLAAALLVAPLNPIFVSADVSSGITYLQAITPDAWVTQALVASGQTNVSAEHLKTVSGNLATDYAKAILAVSAAGQDPKTFGNLDYVAKLKTFYNNSQFGDQTLINDDIWSLLALSSIKDITGQEFTDAKSFILSHQNTDGGWSYAVSATSDSNDTAAAIIALIEAEVSASDEKIVKALDYLKTTQNNDGGFGYQAGADSDSGSDAWVIAALNKLNINAASWNKGEEDPIKHLNSLQDTDGGYWWVKPGTSEFNNKAMSAYAVIALSGKSFPVAYFQSVPAGTFHLRIEGETNTICDVNVQGPTALDLVKNAAEICDYTYNITQESFGQYLRGIGSDEAEGMIGWLYFVNNTSLAVGAGDYAMQAGDEALFYYGDWGWNPTKLILSDSEIEVGQTVALEAKYFNGSNWLPLPGATVYVNGTARQADAVGGLTLTFEQNGVNQVYVDTADFVRSEKYQIVVGENVSQSLNLQVEIDQSNGQVLGDAVALEITPASLDFGKLSPGQTGSQMITLQNTGSSNITVGANVAGDNVFMTGVKINDFAPAQFSDTIAFDTQKTETIKLTVPLGYTGSGIKNGQIIFWATTAN